MSYVFADVETTGFSPSQGDRVVEVACIALEGSERIVFHSYVNPERPSHPRARKVHGRSSEFLSDKPKFAAIAPQLAEFLRGRELVAHNAQFDVGFHDYELLGADQPSASELVTNIADTVEMARMQFPGENAKLDDVAQCLGIRQEA